MAHDFKKQYGQNFLKNARFAKELLTGLNLTNNDFVIEIGPGDGMLSSEILKSGAKMLAIEVDYDLLPNLIKRFNDNPQFDIKHNDILEIDLNELEPLNENKEIKVTGSLPYNISKIIIDKFLKFNAFNSKGVTIKKMGFIVQEEVALKYNAEIPNATELSIKTNILSEIKKGKSIPASQFFPKPKVNGGIIYFDPKRISTDAESIKNFQKLIKIGFSSKKRKLIKTLLNSNKYNEDSVRNAFEELKIDPNKRPSEIEFSIWEGLNNLVEIG